MVGVITQWDVMAHPISTIRSFGWIVFFKAVEPWQGKTFLGLLRDSGMFDGPVSKTPEILERCVELELRRQANLQGPGQSFCRRRLDRPILCRFGRAGAVSRRSA